MKPEFFQTKELSEISEGAQLLFIGLMCLADRDGLMEDVPEVIRGQLRPFTPTHPTNDQLQELHDKGFVVRYQVGQKHYIWIPNFKKHQPIHQNEGSYGITLPDIVISNYRELHGIFDTPMSHIGKGNSKGKDKGKEGGISQKEVAELFNEICKSLPQVKVMKPDTSRWDTVTHRIKEHPNKEFWELIFRTVNASDFLSGRSGAWQGCGFDWILKPANLIKIFEGTYGRVVKPFTPVAAKPPKTPEMTEEEQRASDLARKAAIDAYRNKGKE